MEPSQIKGELSNNKTVLVSVLLPVFNGEKYIAEAVDSILCQTFHNFELLIIDDGSTDNTLTILKNYQNQDSRIRLITRENKGLIATLNEGIDLVRGKWVVRMDSDDIAMPNRIERQLYWIEQTGADLAGSWVKFFGSWDRRVWRGYQSDEAIKIDMMFKCPFVHPSVMMRSKLIKQLKYDPASEKAEDYDLWIRAAFEGWKMINVPEVLLKYRKHSSQVSIVSADKQLSMTELIRKKYWEYRAKALKLNLQAMLEAFKLTSTSPVAFNLDIAESALLELLSCHQGEARRAILDNIYRFYLRALTDHPDINNRWTLINRKYGQHLPIYLSWQIWVIKRFSIHPGTKIYSYVKKIYLFLTR